MLLLGQYFDLQAQIYEYFGYVEDWHVIPITDRRSHYWHLDQREDGSGAVRYAREEHNLYAEKDDDDYEDEIYTQRHLPRWVYRGDQYTMICVDTHTDGNKFLAIYDNALEVKNP